jgi:hypothetical protein
MQRGKQQQNKKQNARPPEPLSQSQIHLYEDLVRLRAYIAKRDECLPGFVCSLNDLALVASERPTNVDALRLINFFLPEILGIESNDSFVKQIFVLTQKSLSTDGVVESRADAAVRKLYDKPGGESYRRKTLRRVTQVALATAICGGVLYTAMTFLKRRRK